MLIGNIGKDPEIRVNPNGGRKRVSFSLATSRRYRDNNGEQKEDTQWHNIVGWGKVAEVVEQLGVRKGTSLYVEGTITNRSWTDQTTGQKQYTTEINMDSFQLLTPRQQQSTETDTDRRLDNSTSRTSRAHRLRSTRKTSICRSNNKFRQRSPTLAPAELES